MRNLLMTVAVISVFSMASATARPPYAQKMYSTYEAFGKKHGDEDKKRVSCSVCHVKNGSRTNTKLRNNYGATVAKGLKKKNDTANIVDALKKAASGKSATAGKTFGDLIAELKLPGTNEPAEK